MFVAVANAAATPDRMTFVNGGTTSYFGLHSYSFNPPSVAVHGNAGTVEVVCIGGEGMTAVEFESKVLEKFFSPRNKFDEITLTTYQPTRPHEFVYRLAEAKIKAIGLVSGKFGTAATITVSFTSVSKGPA